MPTGRERGKEGEGGRAEGGGEVLSGACKVGTMEVDHLRTGVSDTLRRGRSFFPSFPCRNLSLSLFPCVCHPKQPPLVTPNRGMDEDSGSIWGWLEEDQGWRFGF